MKTLAVCQRWLYVIVGWLGGMLGIVRGIGLFSQPLYTSASTHVVLEGEQYSVTEVVTAGPSLDGITFAMLLLVVVLVFG
ncbi:MAG: hypothetical protein QGI09_05375, partial [Dehalococcoidia bacterium]|nr:hypothetical protein [Dehalococcoidia bacterium]